MKRPFSHLSLFLVALSLAMTFLIQAQADAKRAAPREVSPVIWNGVRYTAPHWGCSFGHGGCIEASDAKTGQKLWHIEVYEIQYTPDLEEDAQDVFITSLEIEGDKLIVINEHGETYEVNLETRAVQKTKR